MARSCAAGYASASNVLPSAHVYTYRVPLSDGGVITAPVAPVGPVASVGPVALVVALAVALGLAYGRRLQPTRGVKIATRLATLGYGGILLGPPIIGFIAEATSLNTAFMVLTVLAGAIVLLGGSLRR